MHRRTTSTSISSADFKKLITKYLAPKFREAGLKGTGYNYRKRIGNNCIYVLSFNPDNYGGQCWVEIGLHLDFFPNDKESHYDFNKLTCSSLDVRRRISPDNTVNYSWKYGTTEEDNTLVLDSIWEAFSTDGYAFINQFKEFPIPFLGIEISDIDKRDKNDHIKGIPFPPDIRVALFLSKIHLYIGNTKKAKEFANFGLHRINGRQGSALKSQLKKIIERANNQDS